MLVAGRFLHHLRVVYNYKAWSLVFLTFTPAYILSDWILYSPKNKHGRVMHGNLQVIETTTDREDRGLLHTLSEL